jgi:pimeloyl-ACP methyl ester carboxylesterase
MPSTFSPGCATARRRAFRVNDLVLRALEWGEPGRPGLCFLHGGSAHAHWFDAVAPAFAQRYHVLSLDQRGHGDSAWPPPGPGAYATESFVSDLLGVVTDLGWERMALCGHSMGGHNAMAFAVRHPERLGALVVVDSRPAIPPDRLASMHRRGHRGPRRHPSLEAALGSFRLLPPATVAEPDLLRHLAREGIAERDGGFLYRFDPACNGTRRPADLWPALGRIAAPTLIVRGEHSPILPGGMALEMARRIVRARVEEIPGAHHHVVLDTPAAFVAALGGFLAEGEGERGPGA